MQTTVKKTPYIPVRELQAEPKPGKPYRKQLWAALLALAVLLSVFASQNNLTEKTENTAAEAETIDSLSAVLARIRRCQALPNDTRRFDSLQRIIFPENLHPNDAGHIGPQCVYLILIDGLPYKYGKASLKDVDRKGNPNRINRQVKDLQKQLPASKITHKIVFQSPHISTREIEEKETGFIQQHVDSQPKHLCRQARLPEGNQGHLHKIDFNR